MPIQQKQQRTLGSDAIAWVGTWPRSRVQNSHCEASWMPECQAPEWLLRRAGLCLYYPKGCAQWFSADLSRALPPAAGISSAVLPTALETLRPSPNVIRFILRCQKIKLTNNARRCLQMQLTCTEVNPSSHWIVVQNFLSFVVGLQDRCTWAGYLVVFMGCEEDFAQCVYDGSVSLGSTTYM